MRLALTLLALASVVAAIAIVLAWPGGSGRAQGGPGLAGAPPGVVAFESDRFGNSDVFLQRNGETIRVTDEAAQQGQPAFGCDDQTMYIVSNQNGPLRIWRATAAVPWDQYAEGGEVQFDELTSGSVLDNAPYAYCGAQSYVFFSRFPLCGTCDADVWRMDLDGANAINLTNNPAEDNAPFPFVASDGSPAVVFASNRDGDYDIYSMDMDGSNVRQLTNNPAFDYYPSVGIDAQGGRHLLFESDRDDPNGDIYSQDLGTGAGAGLVELPDRLTHGPNFDGDPIPGPRGQGFVFTQFSDGVDGTGDISWLQLDGTGLMPLVVFPGASDSAAAWIIFGDVGPVPTPTPTLTLEIFTPRPPTPTPRSDDFVVGLRKEDADTGQLLAGWRIEVFQGAACVGELDGARLTSMFRDVYYFHDGSQELSFREVQQPGWEQVTFIGDSPCQTIDGTGVVTFRNRRVGRRGDSDGDGDITAIDATFDLQFTAGFLDHLLGPGDANRDGHVNSVDANLKLQHVAGLYEIPVM